MMTPWGSSQSVYRLAEGIYDTTTAGHGGILVGKRVAQNRLSAAARRRGDSFGSWLAYEEDCDWVIPVLELGDVAAELARVHQTKGGLEALLAGALRSASIYNADYLLERGITPTEPEYSRFRARQAQANPRRIPPAPGGGVASLVRMYHSYGMAKVPKRIIERWAFTASELRNPKNLNSYDTLVASVPEDLDPDQLGILVWRNGLATNRWADGTVGISSDQAEMAEADEEPYNQQLNEPVTTWRDVVVDAKGNFVRFAQRGR